MVQPGHLLYFRKRGIGPFYLAYLGLPGGEVSPILGQCGYVLPITPHFWHWKLLKTPLFRPVQLEKILVSLLFLAPNPLFHMWASSEALPGVLGNRGTRAYLSGEQGNKGKKMVLV